MNERINRTRYILYNLCSIPLAVIIILGVLRITLLPPRVVEALHGAYDFRILAYYDTTIVAYKYISLSLLLFWFMLHLSFSIKRLHDINLSGWLILLIFIPLINILFTLYIIIESGTQGKNNYGPPTLPSKNWEIILAITIPLSVFLPSLLIFLNSFDKNFCHLIENLFLEDLFPTRVELLCHQFHY